MLIYRKLFFGVLVVFVCAIFLLVQQRQMLRAEKEYVVRLQGQTRDALVRGDALEKQVGSLKLQLAKTEDQIQQDFDENAAQRYQLRQACDRQMRKAEKKDSRARKR